jgi:hypothetical protein
VPDPAWERRRGEVPELFGLDFATGDGSLAGFTALVFHPTTVWYWAALVGNGRPYVLVRELDVAPPRSPASCEIRAEALWADLNCETPFDHWSLGLEAFGVAMDDPGEALRGERGDRIGLGFDLEWEATGPPSGDADGYEQDGIVHGDILVGSSGGTAGRVEVLAFDGRGRRRHRLHGWTDTGAVDGADAVVLHRAPLVVPDAVLDRRLCRYGDGTVAWAESVRPAPPTAPSP